MTMAKPATGRLLIGSLILVMLAVLAAMSLNISSAGLRPALSLPQQSQTESRPNVTNGQGTATQSGQSSQSVQASQSSANAVQKPSAPAQSSSPTGGTIQRFADAGPGTVAPAASQSVQTCGPKPCPRPQR